ncbi:Crp/Fnr family transcriptional regulator, partial [Burkholderia gladioli]
MSDAASVTLPALAETASPATADADFSDAAALAWPERITPELLATLFARCGWFRALAPGHQARVLADARA